MKLVSIGLVVLVSLALLDAIGVSHAQAAKDTAQPSKVPDCNSPTILDCESAQTIAKRVSA